MHACACVHAFLSSSEYRIPSVLMHIWARVSEDLGMIEVFYYFQYNYISCVMVIHWYGCLTRGPLIEFLLLHLKLI